MTYSISESFGSFASSIQKEIQYLERVVKEQQEIIEQLTGTGQPKGYVYRHPLDVAERLNKAEITSITKWGAVSGANNSDHLFELDGRLIKQSPFIPAVAQSLK